MIWVSIDPVNAHICLVIRIINPIKNGCREWESFVAGEITKKRLLKWVRDCIGQERLIRTA